MAIEQFANSAGSTLVDGITSDATSLQVLSATRFPTDPQFRLMIDNEILLVTGVEGPFFSVLRGQEGTVAQAHNPGTPVTHTLTAEAITQLKYDIHRVSTMVVPMVAGAQTVATTGYTVLGATPPLDFESLGVGATLTHTLVASLNIPAGSTAQAQLYDVTHATAIYTSGVFTGPLSNQLIQETFVAPVGETVLEFWLAAPTNAGGPVACMQASILETYSDKAPL